MLRSIAVFVSLSFLAPASAWQQPTTSEPFRDGFAKGAYRLAPGMVAPLTKRTALPVYTDEGRRRQITGEVEALAVVLTDGTIGPVRLLTSIDRDSGLDDAAVTAVKLHLFQPGSREGVPVPVVVTIFVPFNLPGVPRAAYRVVGGTADPPAGIESTLGSGVRRPGPGLLRPLPVSKVYPEVPVGNVGVPGQVEMLVVIGGNGSVSEVRVVRPLADAPKLTEATVAAVKQWVFEPSRQNGAAVPLAVTVTIDFARQ